MLVHSCFDCDLERFNRIAAADDFELVISLPAQKPRTSREAKVERLEAWLAELEVQWDWDTEAAG